MRSGTAERAARAAAGWTARAKVGRRRTGAHAFVFLLLAVSCACGASCAAAQGSKQEGERHFQRGRELRQSGDLAGARREFERAAALIPDSGNVFYMLALTLDEMGEDEAARRAYEKSLALEPDRAVAHAGYGEVLGRLGDREGALREQLEANRLKPGDPAYIIALGHAQENAGQTEEARRSFERAAALESPPRVRATAYMRLGYLLAARGEYAGASDALRRGLELDPTDEFARRKLKEVEETRAAGGAGGGTGPPKPTPTPGRNF